MTILQNGSILNIQEDSDLSNSGLLKYEIDDLRFIQKSMKSDYISLLSLQDKKFLELFVLFHWTEIFDMIDDFSFTEIFNPIFENTKNFSKKEIEQKSNLIQTLKTKVKNNVDNYIEFFISRLDLFLFKWKNFYIFFGKVSLYS